MKVYEEDRILRQSRILDRSNVSMAPCPHYGPPRTGIMFEDKETGEKIICWSDTGKEEVWN